MKSFVSFFVVAVLSGFTCFVLLYWMIKMDYSGALTASISVAVAGFLVDYLMKYTNSRKRNRPKEY
jgi:hypothetical protein